MARLGLRGPQRARVGLSSTALRHKLQSFNFWTNSEASSVVRRAQPDASVYWGVQCVPAGRRGEANGTLAARAPAYAQRHSEPNAPVLLACSYRARTVLPRTV